MAPYASHLLTQNRTTNAADPLYSTANSDGYSANIDIEYLSDDVSDGLTDELDVRAIVVSLDGSEAAETAMQRRIASREDAEEFGIEVARTLVEKGAGKILEAITLNRHIIEKQEGA